jgi:hypothetical protein
MNWLMPDPDKTYRVAVSDFELEPDFAYTEAAWQLEVVYHVPTILHEAFEDFLAVQRPVVVAMPRLEA